MKNLNREFNNLLESWKNSNSRLPLLVRGARQVGKTYSIRHFASNSFDSLVEINFEKQADLKSVFKDLDPKDIIRQLQIILNTNVSPGQTLLFFDEIQMCPRAIMSLRYFFEEMPELHVIAAGSLLEFTLKDKAFSMPVGRIQYAHMFPMSFVEFLDATGNKTQAEYINQLSLSEPIPTGIHQELLRQFRNYLIVGGMPRAVATFTEEQNTLDYQNVQRSIIQTYREDFRKYGKRVSQENIEKIYSTAPSLTGKQYKFSRVDRNAAARDLRRALTLLVKAQVINQIFATSATALPLAMQKKEKVFKISGLDIGLTQRMLNVDAELLRDTNYEFIHAGSLAEQVVGQELLAYRNPFDTPELYFWAREKKGSSAEIDFLYTIDHHILPIEVKAGTTGRLKSLRIFLDEKNAPFGIRVSSHLLSLHDKVLSVPFYAVSQLDSLIKEAIDFN